MMQGDAREMLRLGNDIWEIGKPCPKAKDFSA